MTTPHDGNEGDGRPAREAGGGLLTAMPGTRRHLRVSGVSTAVLEAGTGSPVVLLHGAGEFAAIWMRVIPGLAERHRVIVPDLPGHGGSGAAAGMDAAGVVAWLAELIDRTCPSPPAVVGHGLGGAVAARLAVAQGARLSRLVLVDSLGLDQFEPSPSFGQAFMEFQMRPTEETRDALFRQCFVDLDAVRGEMGADWERTAAYALERARTPEQGAMLSTLMPSAGLPAIPAADLGRIEVPTTLIWGRGDLAVPVRVAEAASTRFGWPLHVIDEAGDDPAVERPEVFLALLRQALDAPAGQDKQGRDGLTGR